MTDPDLQAQYEADDRAYLAERFGDNRRLEPAEYDWRSKRCRFQVRHLRKPMAQYPSFIRAVRAMRLIGMTWPEIRAFVERRPGESTMRRWDAHADAYIEEDQ